MTVSGTHETAHEAPPSWWRALIAYGNRKLNQTDLFNIAGNMTFSLIFGLVPILVTIAVMPQLDIFSKLLEIFFRRGLIPANVAQSVFPYLNSFRDNGVALSAIGLAFLLFSTLTLINTVEGAFNTIWDVRFTRPLLGRLLLYTCIMILGPIILGISLFLSLQVFLTANKLIPDILQVPYVTLTMLWTTLMFSLLYRVVPYRQIAWKDALIGGLFVGIGLAIAKRFFSFFLEFSVSYKVLYGALAMIPIFLTWIYIACLIALIGGVIVSALPDFRTGRWRKIPETGSIFEDAVRLAALFWYAQHHEQSNIPVTPDQKRHHLSPLAEALAQYDPGRLEAILQRMQKAGWIIPRKHATPVGKFWYRPHLLHSTDDWIWIPPFHTLTLGDIFHHFVYTGQHQEHPLTATVDMLITQGLNTPLEDWFLRYPPITL